MYSGSGAQLWLMNCGSRLQSAGHTVTFLLPSESLIIEDCQKIDGAKVVTYDADAIAKSPGEFKPQFTELLTPAQVCVTLVRQQRGEFQNVNFMAECIKAAGLKTFLIAKTGTPDPSYKTHFYGGPLFADSQCCVITIAQYTKDFIVENMDVPADLITNVYNGTVRSGRVPSSLNLWAVPRLASTSTSAPSPPLPSLPHHLCLCRYHDVLSGSSCLARAGHCEVQAHDGHG